MACYKCGGALYHLYHSFKNTALVVEKTNPAVKIIKESDVSSKIYQSTINHPHQKTIETKTTRAYNAIQHYISMQQRHNMHRHGYHQRYINHQRHIKEDQQQKEIRESVQVIKQINYVGNVKLREIRSVEYLENQEEETTQEHEQKNDSYNLKISNRTKIKREKEKVKNDNKKKEGIEKRIENLEKEQKIVKNVKKKKNKIRKEKTSKKNSKSEDINLLVLEELIGRGYLNDKKTSKKLPLLAI